MIQEMLAMSVGGSSGVLIKQGSFATDSTNPTEVHDVGFKPDVLYCESQDRVKAYFSRLFYWEGAMPTSHYIRAQVTTSSGDVTYGDTSMPASGSTDTQIGGLVSIDNEGFTFARVAGNSSYAQAPMFNYVAIKYT